MSTIMLLLFVHLMNVQQHKISAVVQKHPLTLKSKFNGQNNNLKKININPSMEKLLKILWYFISNNMYNKRLSQSSSSSTLQDSPIDSSSTINHIELEDSEGGSETSLMNPAASNDYEYRDTSLPDWLPPPPPPPPNTLLPFSSAPVPLESSPYPSPSRLNPFNIRPRRRPFDQRPLNPELNQQDELTLFLVILTIAGFFGLIISMFMPFSLILKSHQQSLASPLGGFQSNYPFQPGFVQPAQYTSTVVAGRRRRKRDESWTINTILKLHNASIEFN